MVVDEGGTQHFPLLSGHFDMESDIDGYLETYGSVTALPSVTEKGYIDIRLSVSSPGGHSSVPPKHTVEFFTRNTLTTILTLTRFVISFRALVS